MIAVKTLPNKSDDKNTTSHKFKQDLIEFFKGKNFKTCLEVGTNRGFTTLVLSYLFDKVITMEIDEDNIKYAKEVCKDRDNITFIKKDVYREDWNQTKVDVVFIDCDHSYNGVKQDYNNACELEPEYIIFDDYGLPEVQLAVKECVDEILNNSNSIYGIPIGMRPGTTLRKGRTLRDYEGMILYKIEENNV